MSLDPLSVVTPARVKILLLPIGDIKQSRFTGFVERLQHENVVRLGNVSPDSRPYRTMFSPLAFPQGLVLYDLSISLPPPSHLALAPFELFRMPLVVLGIADGKDIAGDSSRSDHSSRQDERLGLRIGGDTLADGGHESLSRSLVDLSEDFPQALVHQILVFDHDASPLPEGVFPVPSPERSKTTTVKTVMCDLTARLLAEMTPYAKSLQGLSSLDSPSISRKSTAPNGTASALPSHMSGLSRSGSAVERSRSFSPIGDRPRSASRMPLTAHITSRPGSRESTPDSRATSPPGGIRTPPTTFDELAEGLPVQSRQKESSYEKKRAESRDRVSVNGAGASGLGERERNKGKGRIGVVIGAMYLLAGRWPDAMKELVQSATTARASSDYLWHAKALDYILVCLFMYAWAGMDFRIPDNFYPGLERPSSSSSKPSSHTPSYSLPDLSSSKNHDPADRVESLRSLKNVLPDVTNNILNLYARAWTFTEDKLPPLAFSQAALRFAKLLAVIQTSGGDLNDGVLRYLILNVALYRRGNEESGNTTLQPKADLVTLLFRAYPRPLSESSISTSDRIMILAGIASVLSELGYHRKKALILKELMSALLPALVQARKDGAAEMGVHPAASLASLNATVGTLPAESPGEVAGEREQGMQYFLSLVCQTYGVVPCDAVSSGDYVDQQTVLSNAPSAEAIIARAIQQASMKLHGPQDLKIDVLRSCISICEALPDLGGTLRYSAELLRTAGSGIAPGPESRDGSPDLPIEEQVRLANNISRTLSAARHLGLRHPEAEYWDDFLLRGVEAVDTNPSKSLLSHAKSELELVETIEAKKERNTFIYNPFLKPKSSATAEPVLVAQEETFFRVTLQNLYDFDVVIERVKLASDGIPFDCLSQPTMIGPYRTQSMLLSGIPQSSGSLAVNGCIAKIKGCRERSFPIFNEPWALKPDVKGRDVGLTRKSRPKSTASDPNKAKTHRPPKGPTAATLPLNVIGAQPNIVMKSISLPQSAIMLLEGETKNIHVTLQNTSRTTPVDLLLLSFNDSTASQLQSAIANKELSVVDLYELELATARKPSFRWLRKDDNRELKIKPGQEMTLEIEILGKPGLLWGTIHVDYGNIGIPKTDIKDRFFTRQLSILLTVTVNSSVELVRNDLAPLNSDLTWHKKLRQQNSDLELDSPHHYQPSITASDVTFTNTGVNSILNHLKLSPPFTPHILLLLDLRNSWPNTITLTLEIGLSPSSPFHQASRPSIQPQKTSTQTHQLNPGTTHRIPLVLPRLRVNNPYAPIPTLNQATKRQFVVSATKNTPEAERAMREAFWYREALLDHISATWEEESTGRTGKVELRGARLTARMVAAFKLEDLDIQMTVVGAEPGVGDAVKQTGYSKFEVSTSSFLALRTTLYNRSESPIKPLLRLQPALANQPHNIALDLGKKLLVNGVLQRALPTLGPEERFTVETGFCALSQGIYEWGASVEEVQAQGRKKPRESEGRARARTGDFDVQEDGGRRIWYAEGGCVIVARNEDG